jgi:Flp pilus assembly protein TadD
VEDGAMKAMLSFLFGASLALAGVARAQTPSSAESDSVWKEARRLSDYKEFIRAEWLLESELARHPDDVSLLWLQAGVAGWRGHHAESVRFYESLLAKHPEIADEVRLDLARERLAAGQTQQGLADVDAHLAAHPDDLEAARLRAGALADAQRWDDAEAAFGQILKDHPGDVESRIGIARVANWRGDHERAAKLFQALIDEGVNTTEVWNGLAYARYWAGRSDLAGPPVRHSLMLDPNDREATDLSAHLRWERGPWASADYSNANDSDDLELATTRLTFHQPVSPQDVLTGTWRRQETSGPPRDFDMAAIGVGHERLWSRTWSSDLLLEYQYKGAGDASHMLGEGNASYHPSVRTRFDGGIAREQVLAGPALDLDILDWIATVGGDWRMADRWLVTAALRRHWYSDHNTAWRSSLMGQYDLTRGPRLESAVSLHFEQLSAAESPGHGYYAPDSYFELTPGVAATYTWPSRCAVGGEARAGFQNENHAAAEFLGSLSLHAEVPLARSLVLGTEMQLTDSNLATASGYSRNSWGVFLRGGF